MRGLVTGHNGDIGSVMVPVLEAAGHEIVGLDTFFFEDCTLGSELGQVRALRKDIRDVEVGDLRGFDAVVHLAALCNDPLGDLNPEWTYEINHRASVQLARLARDAGVTRFLYASSCSRYGAAGGEDLLREDAPLRPLTAYAISKARAEEDLARLADRDFSPVFMRNALVCWAHTTGRIRILSDGTPWRPIVHVRDIAGAFAAALEAPRQAVHNQAFNVGSDAENYQVSELADIVRDVVPSCTVEYASGGGPDLRRAGPGAPGLHPTVDGRPGSQGPPGGPAGRQSDPCRFSGKEVYSAGRVQVPARRGAARRHAAMGDGVHPHSGVSPSIVMTTASLTSVAVAEGAA